MNKIKDAFSEINTEEALKQKTLRAIRERNHGRKPRSLSRVLGIVASAACAAVLLVVGGVLYTTQTAYVSIDVNPSIELSLNRFDRVLKAIPKNEDGRKVLGTIDLDHMKYSDALQRIVDTEQALGYLGDGSAMVFAVQSEDTGQQGTLVRESETYASAVVGEQQTTCYTIDEQELEQAHHHGISPGKYMAIQELQEYDPTVTVDEYAHHSMGEIHEEISHHHENEDSGDDDNTAEGHDASSGQKHGADHESDVSAGQADHSHNHGERSGNGAGGGPE